MRILRDLVGGTGGFNENPVIRSGRYLLILGAIGALDAISKNISGASLPDPVITIPIILSIIAGAEKWLRNHGNTPSLHGGK